MSDSIAIHTPKIADLDFTDIYVDENGYMEMKGLNDPSISLANNTEELTSVPDLYVNEAVSLVKSALVKNETDSRSSFTLDFGGRKYRVTKINTVNKKWLTIRKLLYPIPRIKDFKGFPAPVIKSLARLGGNGMSGLILFTGKTGSGKTTVASSLLQEYLSYYGGVAITVERPPELDLDGSYGKNNKGRCFQTEVSTNGYSKAVEDILRFTPRYVLFGEIRGHEEAKEALMLSSTGHLVLATMHSPSPIDAVDRLVDLATDGENKNQALLSASRSLLAVLYQKMTVTPYGKHFEVTSLFFPEDDVRSRGMVRDGNTTQLVDEIERQKTLIEKGEDPCISAEKARLLRESVKNIQKRRVI